MRTKLLLSALAAVVMAAVVAAPACGPSASHCGPSTCMGCCDSQGLCQLGTGVASCGAGGSVCQRCSDSVCVAGQCVAGTDDGGSNDGGAGGSDGGGDGGTDGGSGCGTAVACEDQAIQNLNLLKVASSGSIANTVDGNGWTSVVDARAGGMTATQAYLYARFTATGLQKVDNLEDWQAIRSAGWDIAFRRYVIRLNGGDSGPSCVGATGLPSGTNYDAVVSAPSGATYSPDDFFTDSPACTFVPDNSGLGTSPNVALASFYEYANCVKMTGTVFAVKLADGRKVKLTVTGYYLPAAAQQSCQTSGTLPGGYQSAWITVRWAFLS